MTNIIKDGVIMALWLTVVIIAFAVLSPFWTDFTNSMTEGDVGGEAADELDEYTPGFDWAFNLFFAGMAIAGIIWFILRVYSRDPGYDVRRWRPR